MKAGTYFRHRSYPGIAWRVLSSKNGTVRAWMGDDEVFTFPVGELERIDRKDFCGGCGQLGCQHDGYPREDL